MPPAIPDQPGDLPGMNLALQSLVTVALWVLSIALLLYAVRIARRDGTLLPVLIVLAVAMGSLIEPIYDITYHLYWHEFTAAGEAKQWTLFTAFGLPQPVWVMPAYIVVFAGPVIFMYQGLARSTSLPRVFRLAAITAATTWAFETLMINLHLYSYWGNHPATVLDYPIWIAFMEASQITGFALLVALLSRRATRRVHLWAVFAIFPANFAYTTIGAGFPGLVAINSSPDASMLLLWGAMFVSVGLVATTLWWTARWLIADQQGRLPGAPAPDDPDDATATSPARAHADNQPREVVSAD